MSCYFCDEGKDKNICIECIKNENKVNIWHLFFIIPAICKIAINKYDEERIIRKYFELTRKNIKIEEIKHIIISEFENENR